MHARYWKTDYGSVSYSDRNGVLSVIYLFIYLLRQMPAAQFNVQYSTMKHKNHKMQTKIMQKSS